MTTAGGYVLGRAVTLLDPAVGGGDTIEGDADKDAAFGEVGNDTMWGDHGTVGPFTGTAASDYLEGDNGDDAIHGEAGTDDIVGGNSANDGAIVAGRIGTGTARRRRDAARRRRRHATGSPATTPAWTGCSATGSTTRTRASTPILLFDLATVTARRRRRRRSAATSSPAATPTDLIFGQGGNDTLSGEASCRLRRGQRRQRRHRRRRRRRRPHRRRFGQRRPSSTATGWATRCVDVGETVVTGGPGLDWITGDNASRQPQRPDRPSRSVGRRSSCSTCRPLGGPAISTSTSGGDLLQGDAGNDRIFGQGNGAQPAAQTDPDDARNNDFVGTAAGDGGLRPDRAVPPTRTTTLGMARRRHLRRRR